MELDRIVCSDALAFLKSLPNESANAVITDPPYGVGVADWDRPPDIAATLREVERILMPRGFLAFTIQMPMMVDWLAALAQTGLRYKDHIVWVKRKVTTTATELLRSHESILVYSKGVAEYATTKGAWSDIKAPGYWHGLMQVDAFTRREADLRQQLAGRKKLIRSKSKSHNTYDYTKAVVTDRSTEYANFTNVWTFLPENMAALGNRIDHPTVKPVRLFERLCELLTQPGALVVDPFVGSGTTALAARNTARHWLCGDSSAEYVEIARKRLAEPYTPDMFTWAEQQAVGK